jgi:2-oxoglutarate dehydrogenase E2 component (dihydrolipoamide succinyltransferase)
MKVDLVMPKLGESLQEGTVIKWLKKPGDRVERDEMILEISTDKVDTEVPSSVAGILVSILAEENETVEVGKVIAVIETDASAAQVQAPAPAVAQAPAPTVEAPKPVSSPAPAPTPQVMTATGEKTEIVMPKLGESLQEGTVIKWLKAVGDKVERDEMILEISTDKVDTEVPSPVAGTIIEILAKEGETIEVGKVIAIVASGEVTQTKQSAPATAPVESKPLQSPPQAHVNIPTSGTKEIPRNIDGKFFSPLVRSIAEAEGVTLEELVQLKGTGSEERITKTDILAYIANRGKATIPEVRQNTLPAVVPDTKPAVQAQRPIAIGADDEIIPMDRVRQLISEHMVYSKHTSAHVTSVAEADVTGIVRLRKEKANEFLSKEGFKLTFTPFFCNAVIHGVTSFPMVNVSVDGKNIIKHRRVNLGVATALDTGNLIVPVIKNADALSLTGIARGVYDLSTRARTKKLNPDDIQGGTITLTNVGTFGTLFGTPVINQPQCAIVGVGAIKKRPVVTEIDGEYAITVRDMMYVSITYDHRVIDGMLAGQCLQSICKYLESLNCETVVF